VGIVAEEEQTFQSIGFDQDFSRHPPAFVSQILNQTVYGLDNTPLQHPVLLSGLHILSHCRREGPELTRGIPLSDLSERLYESAVLIDYCCREPVFFRA